MIVEDQVQDEIDMTFHNALNDEFSLALSDVEDVSILRWMMNLMTDNTEKVTLILMDQRIQKNLQTGV